MGCPCSKQVAPTPSRRRHPSSQRSESFCDRKKVVDHFRSTLWNKCVDEHGPQIKRRFPMMVVPVKKILEMTEIKKHEEIKDMLVEWKPGMADVLFVSHTWLRRRAPDRDNVKLDLLKSILVQIVAGKMRDIKTHFMAEAYFDAQCIKGTTLSASLCDGYVWMDVMSIPQAQANHDLQSDAIQSIVSYVADSAFFCVLAGAWRHEDGSVRDVRGWHKRGWCRMEMLANALSPRQKPLIVAQSPSVIDLHAPSGPTEQSFVLCPVGQGQFTADSDRKKLAPVIAGLIEARKAYALATGDLFWYRVLHASQRRQLEEVDPSLVAPLEPLADWMVSMRFEGEHKDETGFDEGLTPLRFAAAVAGRVDLTEELLRQPGVDVEAPLTEPVLVFEGQLHFSILMQACQMHDDPKLIRLLLDAGASAEVPDDGVGCNALTHACVTGKCKVIDLLIEHAREREQAEAGAFNRVLMALPTAPSRAISGANFGAKFTPQAVHNFHALAEYGQAAAFRHCAAKHPDEMRRAFKGEEIDIGLSMASWATVMMGDIETLGEILEAAAQYDLPDLVNTATPCTCPIWGGGMGGLRGGWPHMPTEAKSPFLSILYYAFIGTSPLHQAAYVANLGATGLLIERGAKVDTQEHWMKMTPLMLAVVNGHATVASALLDAGASLDLMDAEGNTAADVARANGHVELAGQLEQHAAQSFTGASFRTRMLLSQSYVHLEQRDASPKSPKGPKLVRLKSVISCDD